MINRTVLTGRLTKDIELKKTNNNKSVIQITLAVEGYNKHTEFIKIVVWNQSAEYLANYGHKGDMVALEGRIQTRSYDGQNGKVYVTEVVADNVQLISNKKEEKTNNVPEWDGYESNNSNYNGVNIDSDDLPFY